MRSNRSRNVAALAAALALTTAACGSSDGESDTAAGTPAASSSGGGCGEAKTVGYVDIFLASPIETAMNQVAEAAADHLGWELKTIDSAGDFTKMQQAVQSLVNEKVDLIIVASADAAPIRQSLQAAKDADIPTIEIGGGNLDPQELFTVRYNEDEKELGKLLGEYLVENVPDAKIANLATTLNHSGEARNEGLLEAVKESGGKAEIVATQQIDGANTVTSTTNSLTGMLTAEPGINAVFAVFDSMATAAASVLRSTNTEAALVTTFATPENQKLLDAGQLDAVVDANLPLTAAVAFDQFLTSVRTGDDMDPNAIEKAGGLGYRIVTDSKTSYKPTEVLAPFLTKWTQDCGQR
jgi:ABC-type sugar transport system substrate-binding protein